MIAIKKNCKEKGNRVGLIGSNPHSIGVIFSRSVKLFFDKIEARIEIMVLIIKIIIIKFIVEKIIYTKFY